MSRIVSSAETWTDRLVGGRWRILSLLDDSGGMASVYLANDERLPRKAVVKIPKHAGFNEEFRHRFTREAFWHAKVEHPHVVAILDRGEEDGSPFLVLQYLAGGNLKAWSGGQPSMLEQPSLHHDRWILPIAQALDAIWRAGVVHRDVKPSNILFDASGRGYLTDFGIVRAASDKTLTSTGMIIGTLQFMSPEQCQQDGSHAIDGRSDQYGLAVTAYQALTGWRYPASDDTAVLYATKFGHVPLIRAATHDPRVPRAVDDVLMRALSPDREARFGSCVEFADSLLDAFGHLAAPTGQSTADTAPRRSVRTVPLRSVEAGEPARVEAAVEQSPAGPTGRPWLLAAAAVAAVVGGFLVAALSGLGDGNAPEALARDIETARIEREAGHWPRSSEMAKAALAALNPKNPRHGLLRGDAIRLLAMAHQADAAEAIAAYDTALSIDNRSADVLRGKGKALAMLDRHDEAIGCFDQASVYRPDDPETLHARGVSAMALYDNDKALDDLSRAVAIDPANLDYQLSLAAVHRRFGEIAKSSAVLTTAMNRALEAGNECGRGEAQAAIRRWDEAIASYSRALTQDPDNLEAVALRRDAFAAVHDERAAAEARDLARRDPGDAGHWLRVGWRDEYTLHDNNAALASYNRGLAIAPKDFQLLLARAKLRTRMEQYDLAVTDLDAAAAVNPHSIEVHEARAAMLSQKRSFDQALALCDRLVTLRPNDPDQLVRRAGVHRSLKEDQQSLADCDAALALVPPRAHAMRGRIHREAKRWKESIEAYTAAIEADPTDPEAIEDRAWVYNETQDFTKAIEDCRAGLAIDSGHEELQQELAYALKGKKDDDEAITVLTQVISRNPDRNSTLYLYRGDARMNKKEYALARADFEKARDISPLDPSYWKNIGKAWEAEDNLDEAVECYRHAATIPPHDVTRLLEPGCMFYRKSKYARARQEFERLVHEHPTEAAAWDWLGATHREEGNSGDAIACFDEAIKLDSGEAHYHRNRAGVLRKDKRYSEAVDSYDKALKLEPEKEDTYYWRGRCHEELGNLDLAERDFAEAARIDPKDSANKSALERVRKLRADSGSKT